MRERPILFSAPMVRAILDGRKTQTRRCVSMKAPMEFLGGEGDRDDPKCWGWEDAGTRDFYCVLSREPDHGDESIPSPYGVPGDRLWVKETHAFETQTPEFYDTPDVPKDGRPFKREDDPEAGWRVWFPRYRATEPDTLLVDPEGDDGEKMRWRPSIFMPRWASRLTLEVTAVRVQRVQEISDFDACAEGVDPRPPLNYLEDAARIYAALWDSINGKRPGCAWADNPWVWAISFRRAP